MPENYVPIGGMSKGLIERLSKVNQELYKYLMRDCHSLAKGPMQK